MSPTHAGTEFNEWGLNLPEDKTRPLVGQEVVTLMMLSTSAILGISYAIAM
jgi:hypothetical protein